MRRGMVTFGVPAGVALVFAGCGRPGPLDGPDVVLRVVAEGSGIVTGEGIDCGDDCETRLPVGSEVLLTGAPEGAREIGWGTACEVSDAGSCSFTLIEETTVDVLFGYRLTVLTTGDGAGFVATSGGSAGIACGGDCSEVFREGASVQLLATAEGTANAFTGWDGTCGGSPSCELVIGAATTVQAAFHARGRTEDLWVIASDQEDMVWSIDLDPASGDALYCGYFGGTVDFGLGGIVAQGRDGFLVRRTPAGATVWQTALRDPDDATADEVTECEVDGTGGVVIGGHRVSDGQYDVTGDGGADAGITNSTSGQDGYVARYVLADGAFDWISANGSMETGDALDSAQALTAGGSGVWVGSDIAGANDNAHVTRFNLDNGSAAATQNATNETVYGPGVDTGGTGFQGFDRDPADGDIVAGGYLDQRLVWGTEIVNAPANSRDILIGRTQNLTTAIWVTTFGGNGDDEAEAVAIDGPTGRIAATGHLFDGVSQNVFLAVLDANGGVLFFRSWPGPDEDIGRDVEWTADGGIILSGEVSSGVDFGWGPVQTAGAQDAFVLRLDPFFEPEWLRTFGGAEDDSARSIAVAADGALWIAGDARGTVDFGGDAGVFASTAGNRNGFVQRLLP